MEFWKTYSAINKEFHASKSQTGFYFRGSRSDCTLWRKACSFKTDRTVLFYLWCVKTFSIRLIRVTLVQMGSYKRIKSGLCSFTNSLSSRILPNRPLRFHEHRHKQPLLAITWQWKIYKSLNFYSKDILTTFWENLFIFLARKCLMFNAK